MYLFWNALFILLLLDRLLFPLILILLLLLLLYIKLLSEKIGELSRFLLNLLFIWFRVSYNEDEEVSFCNVCILWLLDILLIWSKEYWLRFKDFRLLSLKYITIIKYYSIKYYWYKKKKKEYYKILYIYKNKWYMVF